MRATGRAMREFAELRLCRPKPPSTPAAQTRCAALAVTPIPVATKLFVLLQHGSREKQKLPAIEKEYTSIATIFLFGCAY